MSSLFKASTQKATQTSTGTSNQKAVLTPDQEKINSTLFDQILSALQQGPVASQANISQGRSQINDTYDATAKNLESNLAARGFSGPTGKLGQGYGQLAIARNKAIAASDAEQQNQALQRFQQMIQNAFAFNQPREYQTNTSSTGTSTQPGPSIFDRILGYAGQGIGAGIGLGWQPFH